MPSPCYGFRCEAISRLWDLNLTLSIYLGNATFEHFAVCPLIFFHHSRWNYHTRWNYHPICKKGTRKAGTPWKPICLVNNGRLQMTPAVLLKLKDNNILLSTVPANMTRIFQPLDVSVNGYTKKFTKKLFVAWYSRQVILEMDARKSIEKPLHTTSIIELYNHVVCRRKRSVHQELKERREHMILLR